VLFLSSNQVFDGTTPQVAADAPTCPVSEYGRQKARIESALKGHMERGAAIRILRLAKVVSPTMVLLRGWVEALAAGRRACAFHDMRMAPTPIDIVVDAITGLMHEEALGIFQLSGPRDASYADIARYLAIQIGADPALVGPVSAATGGMPPGATPLNTTLDSTALRDAHGLVVPDVWETLEPFLSISARG
jgi:dTDP-4-dehydrorhamnose reductase